MSNYVCSCYVGKFTESDLRFEIRRTFREHLVFLILTIDLMIANAVCATALLVLGLKMFLPEFVSVINKSLL